MSFDFNTDPVRMYGIFPQTPFPLEVSIYGYCRMACQFCFANLNRDAAGRELHQENSAPALFRRLEREMKKEYSPIGFFLRERYPICFSNTTDPFQRDEKTYRASEAFLTWSKANRIPLFIQTRGADVLLDEWDRYAPLIVPGKDVVYVSISQMNDKDRKFVEPGAPPIENRLELVRRLSDHGIPVVVACNPYLKEWVPDPYEYCRLCKENGARGIWLEALHFSKSQSDCLKGPYRDMLFKANLQPMYLIGQLKHWYAACEEHGLDFYPTPRWDAYFGHKAKHPECVDPAWMGGKTLDFNFRILKAVHAASSANGDCQIVVTWQSIKEALDFYNVPNPTLDTHEFWTPYNVAVNADSSRWRAAVGRRLPFHDIIRYFWNHPWENQNFVWYHPLVQTLWNAEADDYETDDEGDLIAVYNPGVNRHHGKFELNSSQVDRDKAVLASFQHKEAVII